MTTATLMFFGLAVASFVPVGVRPPAGWWMAYYYGALLGAWVLISIAAVRRAVPEDQTATHGLAEIVQRLSVTATALTAGTPVDAARHPLRQERRIIVARRQRLYGYIRSRLLRVRLQDDDVRIITDRRVTERRHRLEIYIPERRRAERRHYIIKARLRTRGWAEVRSPARGRGQVTK